MSELTQLPISLWPELDKPHLTLDDVQPVIRNLAREQCVEVKEIGKSFLGLPIHLMTLGSGPLRILAWTQMHGDEPTASAAVLDLIRTLLTELSPIPLAQFNQQFTLKVIPILNPDGAKARTRVNAQGIDINRDAVALQSPEGRLLRDVVDEFTPDIAFNLHDQSPYYTVANTEKPATIAFLAPAFDLAKTVNPKRLRAMQLIVGMQKAISNYIPGNIARYNDDYSYRSFGDTIAGLGASTILIESGAHPDDPNRNVARQMNSVALFEAIKLLTNSSYKQNSVEQYFAIPENNENGLSDVLIRNARIDNSLGIGRYAADVMLCQQKNHPRQGYIKAIGHLSHLHGFQEIDAAEYTVSAGHAYQLTETLVLCVERYMSLLKQGYTHFRGNKALLENLSKLPHLHIHDDDEHVLMPRRPSFLLLSKFNGNQIAILNNKIVWLD